MSESCDLCGLFGAVLPPLELEVDAALAPELTPELAVVELALAEEEEEEEEEEGFASSLSFSTASWCTCVTQ